MATDLHCPVCGAAGRATDWVDLGADHTGYPDRRPSQYVCPNGHRPSDPEWQVAAAEQAAQQAAVLKVVRDAIDSPGLHNRDASWKYNYGDAAEKVLADLDAAGYAVVARGTSGDPR